MNDSPKTMSAGKITLIAVVAVVLILIISSVSTYNSLIGNKEQVNNGWANIDTQLQRRADLIPNLVNTVKGYAAHETEIMTAVSNARAKLAGASTVNDKAQANGELNSALSRLMVVVENYPNLKADSQYTALMDELAGTENRISVARKDYNDVVARYNKKTKTFPAVIFANLFGFDEAEYFQAQEGTQTPPTVNFGA